MIELEVQRLNEIIMHVNEAYISFQSSSKDMNAKRKYLEALHEADRDSETWMSRVNLKTEHHSVGFDKITMPKRDNPFFKLQAEALPFILDLRAEIKRMKELLLSEQGEQNETIF